VEEGTFLYYISVQCLSSQWGPSSLTNWHAQILFAEREDSYWFKVGF